MILFHGTRAVFGEFDPALVGEGAEANSALGVWASASPHVASSYAPGGRLMVLALSAPHLACAHDRECAIWGGPDLSPQDREIGWVRFAAARAELAAAGVDGVWCEMPGHEDMEGAVCVLDPARLSVIRVIDNPEDDELDRLADLAAAADDSVVDWSVTLEGLLLRDEPWPGPT